MMKLKKFLVKILTSLLVKLLCKIESRCLAWPHKILAKTIGEMSVHILGA